MFLSAVGDFIYFLIRLDSISGIFSIYRILVASSTTILPFSIFVNEMKRNCRDNELMEFSEMKIGDPPLPPYPFPPTVAELKFMHRTFPLFSSSNESLAFYESRQRRLSHRAWNTAVAMKHEGIPKVITDGDTH